MMFRVYLNLRAYSIVQSMIAAADDLRIAVHRRPDGGFTIDCGVEAPGGLAAGKWLATACTADLAAIDFAPASGQFPCDFEVTVVTDSPVAACMASQYAGWQIAVGKYFAMGSGPMRAAASPEKLFAHIGCRESAEQLVGILEARKLPTEEVIAYLAEQASAPPGAIHLLVARTASQAGTVQIVARSIETALHKMHELGFDLSQVASGTGRAPLPPAGGDDLTAIGRTNDAILYGGRVTLYVRGDDAALVEIGPKIPSSASAMYGEPFASIFERAGRDFYKIDPQLFSPAQITLINLETGRRFEFGSVFADVLERSFSS